MGEFFKPWKKKVGVATLVIALIAVGGWVRSLWIGDITLLKLGSFTLEAASRQSEFRFVVYRYLDFAGAASVNSDRTSWKTFTLPPLKPREWRFYKEVTGNVDDELIEKWECCGVAVARRKMSLFSGMGLNGRREAFAMSSYYDLVVAPLTLLAAWMLLSRSTKPEKPTAIPT